MDAYARFHLVTPDDPLSHKNKHDAKKLRALRRALKKGRLPAFLDLEQWLRDRRHANTAGAARKLIFERRVMHESHQLGFRIVNVCDEDGNILDKKEIYWPYVPSSFRLGIRVKDRE